MVPRQVGPGTPKNGRQFPVPIPMRLTVLEGANAFRDIPLLLRHEA